MGAFPYGKWSTIFEQLNAVVSGPAPQLPADSPHSQELRDFVAAWWVLPPPPLYLMCVSLYSIGTSDAVSCLCMTYSPPTLPVPISQPHQRPSPAAQLRSADAIFLFQEVWRSTGGCRWLVQWHQVCCLANGSSELARLLCTAVNQIHWLMSIEQNV